ncbi:hypothetical protein DPMN_132588 [Dreissena polymorpha]|uniref:Uncharacterized protein n=1 Tax=Dreissena polymorpha TaxID=45954 RepID=A0A9D4JC76_DREPO|nr:hypothetical protein DPMN_132588 [Dreissena polymorpha]
MIVAQGLLEVAKADLDKVKVSMEKCREQRSEIDRKRRKLIDSYQSKQKSLVGKSSDQNE